jgi:hypothetical protein
VALSTVTIRPNSTSQVGSWSVTGAASAHAALNDNSDSSYVQLLGLCRLDSQVLRVGFPTPSVPAGAKVYSVTLRRRVQSAASSADVPLCYHWFRCVNGTISVAGQKIGPQKSFYNSPCPTTTTPAFTDETILTATTGPGGQAWDASSNLIGMTYDLGRGDSSASTTLRVSEVYLDIAYQQASTVTVTAPTGTVPDTQPTITWTYASPDSQPQQAYRVAVYTAAQVAAVGFVPFVSTPIQATGGYLLGEDLQWTLQDDLTDGTYSAYVQVQSRWAGPGEFFSPVASTTWTRTATSAPVAVPTPVLLSPPPAAAVFNSAVFDAANNRVGLTFTPGTPAATAGPIGATGAAATSGGTGTTTLPVSPTAVGDVLILGSNLTSTSLSISSVSGGGVTTWTRIAGNFVGTTNTLSIWMGRVTTAGAATITVTPSGSIAAVTHRMIAQQFTSAGGAGTTWAVAVAGTGQNNASSTTVAFPTINPGGTNRAYIGYSQTAQTGLVTGQTSGYTAVLDNGNNPFIYNGTVTGSQSPTAAQTPAGVSSTLGVTITATMTPSTVAFTVQASRDAGQTWTPIPSLTYVPAAGLSSVVGYDYVAPLNVLSQYRAIAYAGNPLVASASPSNVVSSTPTDTRHWLKDPANPLLNTPLPVAAPQGGQGIKVTKRRLMGTFHLLGGSGAEVLPFVISGPTYGDELTYELLFIDGDLNLPMTLWPAVDQLDRTGGTLLLQQPDGNQLWVRLGPGAAGQDTEETYDALPGDPTTVYWRRRKLAMTEVDAPLYY